MVHGKDGRRDDHVVSEIAGEQGADGPVDEAGGQHALFRRTAFAAQEAARDPSDGIPLLFKVHGKREKVHAVAGPGGGRCRHQHHRVAVADQDGGVGQFSQLAGFQHQRRAGQFHLILFLGRNSFFVIIVIGSSLFFS
jgi:hypothetical protein